MLPERMRFRALAPAGICVAAVVAAATVGLPSGQTTPQLADRDCSDFPSQAAAQRFFIEQGGPGADPHRLDGVGSGNGIACESLPCPCSRARGSARAPRGKARRIPATVVAHIDGDTIKVRRTGPIQDDETVRLIGIDTPETKRPGTPIECGGPEATESLTRLAPVGARVLLRTDPTQDARDRYERLLAYLQRKGRDLGRRQIARGWATTYVYGNRPFQRVGSYRRAEAVARLAGRGVHSLCD